MTPSHDYTLPPPMNPEVVVLQGQALVPGGVPSGIPIDPENVVVLPHQNGEGQWVVVQDGQEVVLVPENTAAPAGLPEQQSAAAQIEACVQRSRALQAERDQLNVQLTAERAKFDSDLQAQRAQHDTELQAGIQEKAQELAEKDQQIQELDQYLMALQNEHPEVFKEKYERRQRDGAGAPTSLQDPSNWKTIQFVGIRYEWVAREDVSFFGFTERVTIQRPSW